MNKSEQFGIRRRWRRRAGEQPSEHETAFRFSGSPVFGRDMHGQEVEHGARVNSLRLIVGLPSLGGIPLTDAGPVCSEIL